MEEKQMDKAAFGRRLRECRTRQGYTGAALAKAVGVAPMFISEMEHGRKLPSMETLVKLCNVLQISSDVLLCDSLVVGGNAVCSEMDQRIKRLSGKQAAMLQDILTAVIKNL